MNILIYKGTKKLGVNYSIKYYFHFDDFLIPLLKKEYFCQVLQAIESKF